MPVLLRMLKGVFLQAWESGLIAILVDDKGRHVFFVLTDELNSTELADLSS